MDEDYELIRKWGSIARVTITWRPTLYETCTVTSAKHPSVADAMEAAWASAYRLGYVKPKWWQWWRWNELRASSPTPYRSIENGRE